jgi:hypothetical protein
MIPMRLADFILANVEPILQNWEEFARALAPGGKMMQPPCEMTSRRFYALACATCIPCKPLCSRPTSPKAEEKPSAKLPGVRQIIARPMANSMVLVVAPRLSGPGAGRAARIPGQPRRWGR